jgi:hypothetical protein
VGGRLAGAGERPLDGLECEAMAIEHPDRKGLVGELIGGAWKRLDGVTEAQGSSGPNDCGSRARKLASQGRP